MIYLTNGNMPLNAAYADEIVQEDNSTYQLTFRFPTSDLLWEKLKEETFLTADDLHGEQDFVIFEVEKKHGYIQVYANQVFTLMNNYVVGPLALDRATGSTALSRFAGAITRDNPFSFFSDIEDRHTFNIGSKNAMEAFAKDKHSIIGQWGGDLVRHGYQVRLLKNGGSENESLFMYKKNLSSYQHKTSTKSLKTRITFIATVKGEGEKAPDRTFTVTIDSPLINKYSQIYEDVIEVNDQDVKDEVSLRKYGEQYFRTTLCDMMEDSLELEVVGKSDVPVQMFDIVSLFHDVYNLDVRKKITKYTYSPMAKKLKSIGFGQFQSGLVNAIGNAVSDAVKGEAQQLQSDFERQLARELKNADLAFDHKTEELKNEFEDGLNAAKARAEEVKRELSDTIDQRFDSFDNASIQEAKRRAGEALRNAGASNLLAQEAKRIALDSTAKLEEFKRQSTSAQTALSGDLDALKRTVTSEVNQASEYRRTTTEALSRMTGQMNGFATKSEVKQDIDGLTQTFAKMKVGGRNLIRNYDWDKWLPLSSFSVGWKFERVEDPLAKSGYVLKATCTQGGNGGFYKTLLDLRPNEFQGKDMTWSWDMKSSRPITFYDMGFEAGGLKKNVPISTEWEQISNTFKVAFKQYYSCVFYANGWEIGDVVYIRDPQLEEGTVATTPRPAPEDGKDEILAARTEFKQTADGLSTKMVAVETYVGQDGQRQEALRRYTREESAKQATSVRELVTRDYVGKASYQEDVRSIERKLEAITDPKNGSIVTQIANYKNAVDGRFAEITSMISGKANQTDFQRVQETSQLYERIIGRSESDIAEKVARMALTNQLFQVEVGKYGVSGPNLIKNSDFKNGTNEWSSTQNLGRLVKHGFYHNGQKDLMCLSNATKNENFLYSHRFNLERNTDYVLNFRGFNNSSLASYDVYILGRKAGETNSFTIVNQVIKSKKLSTARCEDVSVTFNSGEMDNAFIRFDNNGSSSGTADLYITEVDLYKGYKPRPWQPHPEDAVADANAKLEATQTKMTQLAGSWAIQNINSAGSIVSQINATNNQVLIEAEKIRLKGKTLLDELTAIDGYFKRLFVGEGNFAKLNAEIIGSRTITADKLIMDQAMARMFVSSDIFTDTLAAKEAFINKLWSVVVSATLLEGYKGKIGGFQIGTHDKDPNSYWLTGQNQFAVGMGNGVGKYYKTALWVNWGDDWGKPGPNAWYVMNSGRMICGNEAEFKLGAVFEAPSISYGSFTFYDIVHFQKNIFMPGGGDIYGTGSTPRDSGRNAVVWWNQIGDGTVKYWIDRVSDRRLKRDIVDTDVNAIDRINQLRMVAFDFIKTGKHEEIGLIAQEVEAILPSAISKNPEKEDDYLHIDYVAIVPYLIKAIQELNQKIEKLEKTA